jgi:hypothetical protein
LPVSLPHGSVQSGRRVSVLSEAKSIGLAHMLSSRRLIAIWEDSLDNILHDPVAREYRHMAGEPQTYPKLNRLDELQL